MPLHLRLPLHEIAKQENTPVAALHRPTIKMRTRVTPGLPFLRIHAVSTYVRIMFTPFHTPAPQVKLNTKTNRINTNISLHPTNHDAAYPKVPGAPFCRFLLIRQHR